MRSVSSYHGLACVRSELQSELDLSRVFLFTVIFSSSSGAELKLLRLMFMCACCSWDFYLEVIMSFTLIPRNSLFGLDDVLHLL